MNGYLNVSDSKFHHNTAQNGDGGAILNGRAAAQNALFSGADAYDVQTTIVNCQFTGNAARLVTAEELLRYRTPCSTSRREPWRTPG